MNFDKLNALLQPSITKIDHASILNKKQLEAVETTEGPVLIIAGAGSGKTKTLTHRLTKLIENGTDPSAILLLTFTNKAANEMKTRAKQMLDDRCNKVTACTYHSFCANILRRYADKIDFDPDFVIHDSEDTTDTIKLIITIEGHSKEKDFPKAKDLAHIFSTHVNKGYTFDDIVDIDYPKYEDYVKDIYHIYDKYVEYKKEHNILDYDDLLLQTNKLLEENENVKKFLSDKYQYIMVDEYQDSNFLQLELLLHLRAYENKNICVVGDDQQCLPAGTTILTTKGNIPVEKVTLDTKLIVAAGHGNVITIKPESIFKKPYNNKLIKITTESGKILKATPEHIIFANSGTKNKADIVFTMFSDYDTHKLTKVDCEEISKNPDLLVLKLEQYERNNEYYYSKKEAILDIEGNAYEFIPFDKIKVGYNICTYSPSGKIVKEKVIAVEKEIYKGYVYDINVTKYRNYMAENIVVHNCIYGFRGSEFKNIINFPKQFKNTKLIILDTNYRSNQEILDLANSITNNAKEKYEKNLKGLRTKGEKPNLVITNNGFESTKYVLAKIIEYVENGISLNDIAVLTRGSNDSYELEGMIAQIKKNYNIPYQKFGGIKFLEKSHIKDILAYLKILVNIKDEISWFRIFQLYPNIGPVYARKLTLGIIENGLEELIDEKYKKKKYGEYLPEIYEAMTTLQSIEFQEQLDLIINKYYKDVRNKSIDISSSVASVKKANYSEVKEDIKEAQLLIELADGYRTANSFLTDMTLEAKSKEVPDEILTISTIHSAKGLEFKVVFILNCVDGTFPWVKPIKSNHPEAIKKAEDELEEERRVFYVALTRAKDDLYLMCPKMGMKYGSTQYYEISRFLTEDDIYKKFTKTVN